MIGFEQVEFGYEQDHAILRKFDLEVAPGSFHFLTGPSGSGKTTFLKLCYLALRPTAGTMTLFGQEIASLGREQIQRTRRRIGILHQDCQFLDHLSLVENIALPRRVRGHKPEQYREDLADLVAWVGLNDRQRALPPELSGGERQRAALARAVIGSPDLILADEPTGNVDWAMALQILRLLIELNRLGRTVLIVSHDLNLIRAARSEVEVRLLRLSEGRIEAGAAL